MKALMTSLAIGTFPVWWPLHVLGTAVLHAAVPRSRLLNWLILEGGSPCR